MDRIANLAARRRAYRQELWTALPILGALLVAGIVLGATAVMVFGAQWTRAALTCAVIMGPPIWFFWPDYPTQDDVERDRAVRRAAGLPDEVDPD